MYTYTYLHTFLHTYVVHIYIYICIYIGKTVAILTQERIRSFLCAPCLFMAVLLVAPAAWGSMHICAAELPGLLGRRRCTTSGTGVVVSAR